MKFNLKKKTLMLGGLSVLLVATAVTFALLSTKSQQNVNQFEGAYGQVNISVIENDGKDTPADLEDEVNKTNTVQFDKVTTENAVEKTVRIKNLDKEDYKTTDTYVRVKLVPQIVSDNDSSIVYGGSVKLEYTMNTTADDKQGIWKYDNTTDTFYYTRALAPNEVSTELLKAVKLVSGQTIPDGYHLELNVLADGIIANPITNLKNAWELEASNGDYFSSLVNVETTMENK